MHPPLNACGQVKSLPNFGSFDVFRYMARVRFGGRLAQPSQPSRLAALFALEQLVQPPTANGFQRVAQRGVNAPGGTGNRFGANSINEIS